MPTINNLRLATALPLRPALLVVLLMLSCIGSTLAHPRRYGMAQGLPCDQARQVVCMPDGRMVVQTDGALALFDGERFHRIALDRRRRVDIEGFWNIDNYIDPEGRLWIKSSSDLYLIDGQNYACLDARAMLAGIKVGLRNLFVTADGVVWADGKDGRLYRCTRNDTLPVMSIEDTNAENIRTFVVDVVQVGSRYMALLSDGTMRRVGGDTHRVTDPATGYRLVGHALNDTLMALRRVGGVDVVDVSSGAKVQSHDVGSIFQFADAGSGRVLFATEHELYTLTAEGGLQQMQSPGTASSLQGAALDRQGGMWVCTFDDGLFYTAPYRRMGRWVPRHDIVDRLWAQPDDRGRLWATWSDGGITCDSDRYSSATTPGLWGRAPFCIQVRDSLFLTCVRMNRLALFVPPRLTLLAEHYPGLLRFRNVVDGCRWGDQIVVGSQNGIYTFDCATLSPHFESFALWNENAWSNKVNCLLPQGDSLLWVGTPGGLFRVTPDGWERVRDENIQSLAMDAQGRLWWTTIDGTVARDGCEVKSGADRPFAERKAWLAPDGHLEFATADALFVLHPDSTQLPSLPLAPKLISASDTLMSHDRSSLRLCLSALAYGLEEQVAYRYRLQGAEEEWHLVTHTNGRLSVDYDFLPPGDYRFEAQAALRGQPWGPPFGLNVSVSPPWWRSWWACLLYLLLLASMVATYVNMVRAQADNERKEARIRALLFQIEQAGERRASVEEKADNPPAVAPEVLQLSPLEEEFVARAKMRAEEHLADGDYSVEQFASDMAMDRTTLYRKLKESVGQSPLEFLRTVRLRRAATLLRSGRYNVGEVSELTGFANPRAFSKYFKAAYGVLPSRFA